MKAKKGGVHRPAAMSAPIERRQVKEGKVEKEKNQSEREDATV